MNKKICIGDQFKMLSLAAVAAAAGGLLALSTVPASAVSLPPIVDEARILDGSPGGYLDLVIFEGQTPESQASDIYPYNIHPIYTEGVLNLLDADGSVSDSPTVYPLQLRQLRLL